MKVQKIRTIQPTVTSKDNPYLQKAWVPNYEEFDVIDLQSKEGIPEDIEGVYLRNTENQIHEPIGRYHPFDGDGMIHSISFKGGKADYRNRFVETAGFKMEQILNQSIWAGLMERGGKSKLPGWGAQGGIKDSSSTDVVVHSGKVLSTFYQCGDGYRLDPITLEQFGRESWVPIDGISSHPKVDLRTGELLFFNYSKHAPYMHYGVVDSDNNLKHYTPIPLPGPRLPHDMAFTKNYSIFNDLPLFWDTEMLKQGVHATRMHDLPSRFAVIPRYGTEKDIKWFEAEPTFVLHWNNAYEDGDEIILEGYFQEEPWPANYRGAPPGLERMMAFLDLHLLKPSLHRWIFNLKTGATREEKIDDRVLEFGTINHAYDTTKHRFTYSCIPTKGFFTFDGFSKQDLTTGSFQSYKFEENIFGSEISFAPKINAIDEDDGYLVSITTDLNTNTSECVLFDAKNINSGPVCTMPLPHMVCAGTHATWAQIDEL